MNRHRNYGTGYWKTIADRLACGIAVLDRDGIIEYANPSLEQILGCGSENLTGKCFCKVLHPQDYDRFSTLLVSPPNPEEPVETKWRVKHQDGTWRLLRIHANSFQSEVTSDLNIILDLCDITISEQAEHILKQRNLELALLNQAGRTFSASLDLDKVLSTVLEEVRRLMNVVACSIWLVDPETEEIVCRQATGPRKGLVRGWRLPKGQGIVGMVATTGQSLNIPDVLEDERHFQGVDEQTGLALRSIVSVPLQTKDRVIGVIQALDTQVNRFKDSDMTLLKALSASAAIAIDNARLVETLRHRTAELKESNRELEAFAHTVAHDLKGPLTHVIGYADVLYEYGDDITVENQREYIHAIRRSGRKMTSIIDELMLLAELRKEEVNLSPLNMENIVQEALERIQPMRDKKEATIQVPKRWPEALGYGPWIEEVWVNYISNALKYGGDPPSIELGAEKDNNNSVAFWVRDNGKGLTKEEQSQLFVPFTHLKSVDTEGYGLGLSIVHRIIDKLDGEVWVRSTPEQGSTFGFTLQKVKYGSDY